MLCVNNTIRFDTAHVLLLLIMANTFGACAELRGAAAGLKREDGQRRDQMLEERVCLVEPNVSGRCPFASSVPGSLQKVTQAKVMSLPECNDGSLRRGGSMIGSDQFDFVFKRRNENSISYVYGLPDPIRGTVSLVLDNTFAILRNKLVGTRVMDFESLSLPTFSSNAAFVDLSFHIIDTEVTDITTNPDVPADCIMTIEVPASDGWNNFVVDKDTRVSNLETNRDCPTATTLGELGPEWSFYTADLGVGCTFAVNINIRDGAVTFDNIAIASEGKTTVYDFEL